MTDKTPEAKDKDNNTPEVKQDAGRKPAPENLEQQGQTGNTEQNTRNRQLKR